MRVILLKDNEPRKKGDILTLDEFRRDYPLIGQRFPTKKDGNDEAFEKFLRDWKVLHDSPKSTENSADWFDILD